MSGRWLSGRTREAYLFLFIPLPSFFPLSLCPFLFYFFVTFPLPPCQFGRFFFLKEKATRRLKEWTKPASWESLSRGWRPWARGTMRGERITSAATLWWVKINRRLYLASCILYLSHMYPLPFITSTFSSILTLHITPSPLPVSWFSVYPPGGEAGAATLPSSFFLPFPGFTWRPSIVSHATEIQPIPVSLKFKKKGKWQRRDIFLSL